MALTLGLFAWFGYDLPLPERYRMIRAAGFDALSLWWGVRDPANLPRLQRVPDLAREAGLVVDSIHVPFRHANALWAADPVVREPVMAQHMAWVDDCARHRIPRLVMHVVCGGESLPAPSAEGLDGLRRLAAHAETRGVVLALENTRRPDYLAAIFDAIPSPALGLCYDAAHDWLWGYQPPALLRRYAHRLQAVHIADTEGRMDRHLLPGDGIVDWPAVMAAIPKNYPGTLLLEVMPYGTPGLSAEAFLAEAYRRGQQLIAR